MQCYILAYVQASDVLDWNYDTAASLDQDWYICNVRVETTAERIQIIVFLHTKNPSLLLLC